LGIPALCADSPDYKIGEVEITLDAKDANNNGDMTENNKGLLKQVQENVRSFLALQLGQTEGKLWWVCGLSTLFLTTTHSQKKKIFVPHP